MGKLGYRNTKKLTQTAEMESGGAGRTRQGTGLSVPCRAALQCQEVTLHEDLDEVRSSHTDLEGEHSSPREQEQRL